MSYTNKSPVELVLERLDGVKPSGKGWTARCPAHKDKENSLSVSEGEDGRALLKCFAGCSVVDINNKTGLAMRDLFKSPDGYTPNVPQQMIPKATVAALALEKELPESFLRDLGLKDLPTGGVEIPYKPLDGMPIPRQRLRMAIKAKEGSLWGRGTAPIVPYGLERLNDGRQLGTPLFLVEGESDAQT